jgi:hypothetical protein
MLQDAIHRAVLDNMGHAITLQYGSQTDTVTVLAVDADGFLCRSANSAPHEPVLDWWISFADVHEIQPAMVRPISLAS